MAKPDTDALETYTVIYRGGLADLPKAKAAGIKLILKTDSLVLEPTPAAKKFWPLLEIPYEDVNSISLAARQVSTFEALAGGLDSKQLDQVNNLHFDYVDGTGQQHLLRFEMLTGITIMGQAKKAKEFEDRLRVHGIANRFRGTASAEPASVKDDIPAQITKLASLRDAGILSEEEFSAKKGELLARL